MYPNADFSLEAPEGGEIGFKYIETLSDIPPYNRSVSLSYLVANISKRDRAGLPVGSIEFRSTRVRFCLCPFISF
jgi:hypothetical protein